MKLTEYLDLARERTGIPSDNRLSIALGVSQQSVVAYRRGTATPTPAKMVRLAHLAGVPAEVALLDRAAWQADDPVSRDVMTRLISEWMERPAANPVKSPASLGAAAVPTETPPSNNGRLRYIMETARLWAIEWMQSLSRDDMLPAS